MVTTITTATSLVSTATAAGSLTLIVILTLLSLLIQKEIFSGIAGTRARRLSQALNVAIVPLIIAFATSIIFKVADLLY